MRIKVTDSSHHLYGGTVNATRYNVPSYLRSDYLVATVGGETCHLSHAQVIPVLSFGDRVRRARCFGNKDTWRNYERAIYLSEHRDEPDKYCIIGLPDGSTAFVLTGELDVCGGKE